MRTVASPDGGASGPTPEEAAYQRGWEAGRAALLEEHQLSLTARLAALEATESALADASSLLEARFTESLHALAIGVARHVVGAEFTAHPELVDSLITRALALAAINGPLMVRLHPDDLAAIHDLPGVRATAAAAVELRWVADASILRGGCVVEGPASVVDGRIDRVLLDIYEKLASD
jgi:flagellar assembly protein FliH